MTGGGLDAHVIVRRGTGYALDARVQAAPGEVVAVMGPSGAGKSTLLTAIAGLVTLSAGHVRIGDDTVASTSPHVDLRPAQRGVVLLGQDARLFPHLSARENVAFGPRARGVARRVARADADDWLERVGLRGAGARRPDELSGGQQQRVAVARALATTPRLLLLDEPLTSLDPETAADVRGMLHEQLTSTSSTALIVTHDAVDAASLATRLVFIEGGVITQAGPVAEVLAAPATSFGAAVSGLNRVLGVARHGLWRAPDASSAVELAAADEASRAAAARDGAPLAAVFRPSAVRLEPVAEPSAPGAPEDDRAGSWTARIVRIERTPSGARVHTSAPAVAVDVSPDAVAAQGLAPGLAVHLRVDAAAVRFAPVPAPSGA